MRSIFAGLLILLLTATSFAQSTTGEVESIGFGGYIRPDCWTPMVVRLNPGKLEPGIYQIQVEQSDTDRDKQVFTRTITVNAETQASVQKFWMYFMPQVIDSGLTYTGSTLPDLNKVMKVWLCNKDGSKQIAALPITSGIRNVDESTRGLGRKFVLCVTDGSSKPNFQEYSFNSTFGVMEEMEMVIVRPDELPESVLGFDGIDAVVWMTGDSRLLSAGASTRQRALTEYVRLGGKLVVTQPADRTRVETLEPLLPIKLKDASGNWLVEVRDRKTLSPLRSWARPIIGINPWLTPRGPFKVARATALQPGAVVSATIDWNDDIAGADSDETPFMARWGYGMGEVVWVAQNLGDTALTAQIPTGWIGVWDKVFDIKNDPRIFKKFGNPEDDPQVKDFYSEKAFRDLGESFVQGVEHDARGAALVLLAVAFFVVYWVLSGPVSYLILAGKKKKGLSWPIFAASAIVATLLTVGVVKLVLSADADTRHVTFVRLAPGQPAIVESRLGVYLTKSSNIAIALQKTDPSFVSYLSAFAPYPTMNHGDTGFTITERYNVPIPDSSSNEGSTISVPFRSTLKKLQARWVGTLPSVEGTVKLIEATEDSPSSRLTGVLTNKTGRDLSGIYFGFMGRAATGTAFVDRLFFVPKWPKDGQIDLDKQVTAIKASERVKYNASNIGARPTDGKVIGDTIVTMVKDEKGNNTPTNDGWNAYWADGLRNAPSEGPLGSGVDPGFIRSFPLTSLYERVPISKKYTSANSRYDLLRRGARHFDMSQSMAAGELVILAQDADNELNGKALSKLPFPLEVDHDVVTGEGTTFYQITLPLTRVTPPPTTQAVEK